MLDRHQCEVRLVLAMRSTSPARAAKYLQAVAHKRGAVVAHKLEQDVAQQWQAGNRGARGDWRYVNEQK